MSLTQSQKHDIHARTNSNTGEETATEKMWCNKGYVVQINWPRSKFNQNKLNNNNKHYLKHK